MKAVLNQSGLGSHPEMVRLVIRLGRALTEAEGKARAPWDRVAVPESGLRRS